MSRYKFLLLSLLFLPFLLSLVPCLSQLNARKQLTLGCLTLLNPPLPVPERERGGGGRERGGGGGRERGVGREREREREREGERVRERGRERGVLDCVWQCGLM